MAFDWSFLDNGSAAGTPVVEEDIEGGFLSSAKKTVGMGVKGVGQFASDFLGVDHNNFISEYGQGLIEENPTAIQELGDIAENPFTAITEAVGNAIPSMAGMLGARAVGTGITALAPAATAVNPLLGAATYTVGQVISWFGPAAVAASAPYASIRDKQIFNDPAAQESAKEKVKALVGAATVGAIETKFGPQNWALGLVTKEGRNQLAKKFAATSLGGRVLEAGTKGAAVEGAEEIFQNPIEQYFSNDDFTSDESVKDTIFGGAMGAIGGGVLGAGFGVASGGQKKSDSSEEPTSTWQDNLDRIRKESIIKAPESILSEAGIDTSQDAKAPVVPEMFKEFAEQDLRDKELSTKVFDPTRDVPGSEVQGEPLWRKRERSDILNAQMDEQVNQYQEDILAPPGAPAPSSPLVAPEVPGALRRDIIVEKDTNRPLWDTPEYRRKIKAADEIDKYFTPTRYGQVKGILFEEDAPIQDVSGLKVKEAVQEALFQKQEVVEKLEEKSKKVTNLVEKKKVRDKIVVAKEKVTKLKREVKKLSEQTGTTLNVGSLPEVKEFLSKNKEALVETELDKIAPEIREQLSPEAQSVLSEAKSTPTKAEIVGAEETKNIVASVEEVKKGAKVPSSWKTSVANVSGKSMKIYSKDNFKGVKKNDKSYLLAETVDGDRVNYGTFKSLKDMTEAAESRKTSEEFYGVKEKPQIELNEDQLKLVANVNVDKVASLAQRSTSTLDDNEAHDRAVDAIQKAAKKFDPSKEVKFETYATSRAIGAIRDYKKTTGKTVSLDTTATEGGTSKKDMVTKEQIEESASVSKRTKSEVKEEEKPSEVRKISVEEYLNEKNVKERTRKDDGDEGKRDTDERKENVQKEKEVTPSLTSESSPEERRSVKREFVDKATTADKLIRFGEFSDRFLGGSGAKGSVKTITKYVQKMAAEKLKNIPVKDTSKYPKIGTKHPAQLPFAFYSDGTIYVNSGYFSAAKSSVLEEMVLHETVHGLTMKEMSSNKELKSKVIDLMMRARSEILTTSELALLESKYNFDPVKITKDRKAFEKDFGRLPAEVYYGLLNEKEFLAQAFSSPEFQLELKRINLEKPKGILRTLWDKFVSTIREALSIPSDSYTAFDEALSLGTQLFKTDIETGKLQALGAKRYAISPSLSKSTKSWEDREKEMLKGISLRGRTIESFRSLARDVVKSASEVLRKINPKLLKPMRSFEMQIAEANVAARGQIKDFLDGLGKVPLSKRNLLWLSLSNTEPEYVAKKKELLKRYGLEESYSKVDKLLKEIYKAKDMMGLNDYGAVEDYFPRRVKDVDGLMKKIKEDPEYNVIQIELDRLGDKASQEDKEHLVKSLINTGRFPAISFLKETSGKKRKILTISSEWKNYYEDTSEALLNHIYENNELIAAHRMFSDNPARQKLIHRRDSLYKKLEGGIKDPIKKKEYVSEIEQIESFLKDKEKSYDKLDTILVQEAPDLSPEDARQAINVIKARLSQKGMSGAMAAMRNVALMSALGSPTSAITQIGDLAFSIYKNGAANTIKAILGNKIITAHDLDLEHSMKEFQTEGTAKWLDKVLTISGLKYMDMFGKNNFINASLLKAKELSLEEFKKKYEYLFGEETERTYQDIKEDKNTELSRFFAFNELSDYQPISLIEMPIKYQGAGNYRIFYALKSYNIKAINTIYRESIHAWRTSKTSEERREAARNTGKLIFLMVLAGATADELKDLLLGKSASTFSDNVHNNLLKIAFMSRYTLDQGFSKGFFETMLKDILIPPTGIVDDPFKDIISTFKGEPDWKTIQNLPWGKLPYEWFSNKAEERDLTKMKKRILDGIKGGDSISEYRDEIKEYNSWASRNKKDTISYSTILKAKKLPLT